MLSCQATGRRQAGQAEPGRTTERRSGRRWMQTFRNEPATAPTPTTKNQRRKTGIPASAPEDQAAPVPDLARLWIVEVVVIFGVARQGRKETGDDDLQKPVRGALLHLVEAAHRPPQVGEIHVDFQI